VLCSVQLIRLGRSGPWRGKARGWDGSTSEAVRLGPVGHRFKSGRPSKKQQIMRPDFTDQELHRRARQILR
jgi:hypothetical protein